MCKLYGPCQLNTFSCDFKKFLSLGLVNWILSLVTLRNFFHFRFSLHLRITWCSAWVSKIIDVHIFKEINEILVIFDSLFLSLFIALTDHSVTCSEKIVNLHEAALEEIEKASEENGNIFN